MGDKLQLVLVHRDVHRRDAHAHGQRRAQLHAAVHAQVVQHVLLRQRVLGWRRVARHVVRSHSVHAVDVKRQTRAALRRLVVLRVQLAQLEAEQFLRLAAAGDQHDEILQCDVHLGEEQRGGRGRDLEHVALHERAEDGRDRAKGGGVDCPRRSHRRGRLGRGGREKGVDAAVVEVREQLLQEASAQREDGRLDGAGDGGVREGEGVRRAGKVEIRSEEVRLAQLVQLAHAQHRRVAAAARRGVRQRDVVQRRRDVRRRALRERHAQLLQGQRRHARARVRHQIGGERVKAHLQVQRELLRMRRAWHRCLLRGRRSSAVTSEGGEGRQRVKQRQCLNDGRRVERH